MKAQLTVFIIIALLVLISFSITIYIGYSLRQSGVQEEQQQTQLNLQPFNDYITSCLALTSSRALALIGRQGGVLYERQGGITSDPARADQYFAYTDENLGTLNVTYLIIPPTGDAGYLSTTPPDYPFETFPYHPRDGSLLFDGYYGINKLPPLYTQHPTTNVTTNNSIQENLETFIATNTHTCADFATFEERGYTINAGEPRASLLFATAQEQFKGEEYVTVEIDWPINVTSPDGTIKTYQSFTGRQPVRLATIYYTTKQIIDADVSNIHYTPPNRGAFTTRILSEGDQSFIIVTDTQSIADDTPFEFWIPRKNRRPALWHLNTTSLHVHIAEERSTTFVIDDNSLRINDPCPESDAPLTLPLRASDPDEDNITFHADIPQSEDLTVPKTAAGVSGYLITIYAQDQSNNTLDWYDHQLIPLTVSPCIA